MKIFFLYHERWEKDQAEPLLRASKELNIECIPCPSNPGVPELLWPDYNDSQRREDLDVIFRKIEKQKPDLILVHTRSLTPYLLRTQIPLILIEHTDGTALELSRHLIHLPNILSVVKGSVFSDYNDYNSYMCEGMFHGRYINYLNLNKKFPYKKISNNYFKKIILGYSFGCFPSNKRFLKYDLKKERKINISFMGNINYARSKLITEHRKMAAASLQRIENSIFRQNVCRDEYDEIMLNSNICLSPYGYGVCYRSFESIFCGCITIQPYSDFMLTWPNIYIKNKIYFESKPDFSNIKELTEFLLDNYKKFKDITLEKREELICNFFNNVNLSKHIYENIIKKSLNNAFQYL